MSKGGGIMVQQTVSRKEFLLNFRGYGWMQKALDNEYASNTIFLPLDEAFVKKCIEICREEEKESTVFYAEDVIRIYARRCGILMPLDHGPES